jgi:hypothetical protein
VSVHDGALHLTAHGDRWTDGPVGLAPGGTADRADGRRVGAAIATRNYLGSGRFEVRMKVAPELGVCSALWTFHYHELYPGDPGFTGAGPYLVVNHEIDVELPGRPGFAERDIGFDRVLDTTWVGVTPDTFHTSFVDLGSPQDDGEFHDYRVDWHTGDDGEPARVEFFVDGDLVATNTDPVPTNAGRLWLGAWFPDGWAGDPDFAETEAVVDEVRYQPFDEAGDTWVAETYPEFGWADE